MRPIGARVVGPPGTGASGPAAGWMATSADGITEETEWVSPPRTTTSWGATSAGTQAGSYTPNGLPAPGPPPTPKNPGMLANAISITALEKARPTLF